jgi:hypothetical protein
VTADTTAVWAEQEVAHLVGLPEYGTPEWHNLEPDDGRRLASLILAAEAWRLQRTDGRRDVPARTMTAA